MSIAEVNFYGNSVLNEVKERLYNNALDDDVEGTLFSCGVMQGVTECMAMYVSGKDMKDMWSLHDWKLRLAKMSANETTKFFTGYAAGIQIIIQYIDKEIAND